LTLDEPDPNEGLPIMSNEYTAQSQTPPPYPHVSETLPQPLPYYPQPPQTKVNGLAIAGMVLGIIWIYWIGSILAVIFGHVALNQMKTNPGKYTGRGMAIAAVALGWVGVGTLLSVVLIFVAAGASS
jgi:hypothetical protein